MFKIFFTILSICSILAVDDIPIEFSPLELLPEGALKLKWPKRIFPQGKIIGEESNLVSLSEENNKYLQPLVKLFDDIE